MKQWALIIGGSSGIGLATARKLGKEGFNVLIIHRDRKSAIEKFSEEIGKIKETGVEVFTFNFDATSTEKAEEQLPAIKEALHDDKIALMLHAVSRGNLKPLFSDNGPGLTDSDLALTLDAMAVSFAKWARILVSNELLSDNARIISLTSAGSEKYWQSYAAVGMAKAALEASTRYMAVELASRGIRVNAIHAGITDTPSLLMIPGYDRLKDLAARQNPSGRMTRPEDVANVIYLLSKPEADWINGSVIHVDGGEHLIG